MEEASSMLMLSCIVENCVTCVNLWGGKKGLAWERGGAGGL
jgi:hypothetical protein